MAIRDIDGAVKTRLSLLSSVLLFACGGPPAEAPRAEPKAPTDLDAGRATPAAPVEDTSTKDASVVAAPPVNARNVLVISIDGLRHDYVDDAARAPTLRHLRDEGAAAKSLKSVWPTMTFPAHTTLVTGTRPARHGIANNIVFDPFNKNEHGWYWYAYDIKVPTLWDAARKADLDVGNVYWPVTVGADIPFSVPQMWRAKTDEDDKLLRALMPRGLLHSVKTPPAEHRGDRERTDAALEIIRDHHPRLMFVYLTDLDTVQHERGPMSPEALKTLKAIDGYVGELVSAYGSTPLTLALVSDHGFLATSKEIRPNVALRGQRLLSVVGQKLASYKVITWKAGATAAIVPQDPKDATSAKAATELFTRLAKDPANGIARVLTNEETANAFASKNAACVLLARPGYLFSESFEPPLVAKSNTRGAHGYAPDVPEMGASLFFWGDGIKRGDLGEVDMIDVAPTIASLLDLSLPDAEGKPLAAALRRDQP